MKDFTQEALSKALLPHRTRMFSDIIAQLDADPDLSTTRKRDMVSGLRRTAQALGTAPSNIPADPQWLQPRLAKVSPVAIGLAVKSWQNIVSNARAALAYSGIVSPRRNRQQDLHPAWRALWQPALDTGKIHGSLARFVYFLDRLGVLPDEVGNEHVAAFHAALIGDEIRKSPEASLRNAINAWNRAVAYAPGWPQTRLDGLPPRVAQIKLPRDAYPPSFAEDLARFEAEAGRVNFLEDPDKRPLSVGSIEAYTRVIERFAGGVVKAGVPAERITDIAALLTPDLLETGLHWFYARYDNTLTPGFGEMILVLQQVGRRHLGRSDQPALDKLVQRLPRKRHGLTEKNRARLRPMLVPKMTARIAALPDRLFERVGTDTTHKACLLRENAIALAILLYCPIRRMNLVSIDCERHLQSPGDGSTYLVFSAKEVKNRAPLEFELPAQIVKMVERHLQLRSPRLCPPGTPYLFPKRDGSCPMPPGQIATNVTTCLKRELGLDVNLHLFRHFAAHLLLEAAPGNYEAARRLLGHSRLSSTLNAYTGIETTMASRQYSEIIEGLKG